MTTRDAFADELKAYVDNELPFLQRVAVRRHVARCRACQEELRQMTQIADDLREHEDAAPAIDPGLRTKIIEGFEPPQQSDEDRLADVRRRRVLRGRLAMATAAIAGIVIGPFIASNLNRTRPFQGMVAMAPPAFAPAPPPSSREMVAQGDVSKSVNKPPVVDETERVAKLPVTGDQFTQSIDESVPYVPPHKAHSKERKVTKSDDFETLTGATYGSDGTNLTWSSSSGAAPLNVYRSVTAAGSYTDTSPGNISANQTVSNAPSGGQAEISAPDRSLRGGGGGFGGGASPALTKGYIAPQAATSTPPSNEIAVAGSLPTAATKSIIADGALSETYHGSVAPGAQSPAPPPPAPVDDLRRVHREAAIGVEVDDPEARGDDIEGMVKATGGYVASNTLTTGDDGLRTATLDLRIPVDSFDTILGKVAGLGKVTAKNVTGEDITEKISDAGSGEQQMEQEVQRQDDRIKRLGRHATWDDTETARDLRVQLAQYRARLVLLKKLSELSNIAVTLTEKAKPATAPAPTGGYLNDVGDQTKSALGSMLAALTTISAILIWALVFAPIWIPVWLGGRWAYRRYVGSSNQAV